MQESGRRGAEIMSMPERGNDGKEYPHLRQLTKDTYKEKCSARRKANHLSTFAMEVPAKKTLTRQGSLGLCRSPQRLLMVGATLLMHHAWRHWKGCRS
mmetsp:Transcript_43374/g.114220  ORF Transcript_43374/g.114220 Transcript_43374/m.114220 type:complete len:98 (+) Transcript_43374:197-490(+)